MPRGAEFNGMYSHVVPLSDAEIVMEGIISEDVSIVKQVEIREQERTY